MASNSRFLLGHGERLTAQIAGPGGGQPTEPPYSFDEALDRLAPEVQSMSQQLDALPELTCPANEAVATFTLHPQALAKSFHPRRLLDQFSLRQVGSRPVQVKPEKWTKKTEPELSPSTELYVAGDRENFRELARSLEVRDSRINDAVQRLEEIHAQGPAERLRNIEQADRTPNGLVVELIVHATATDEYVLEAFEAYSRSIGAVPDFDRRLHVGGLCFLPTEISDRSLAELSQFTFLRSIRPISRLRGGPTVERTVSLPNARPVSLPPQGVIDSGIQVAVLDGGFDSRSPISAWVNTMPLPGIGPASAGSEDHGHAVSSAILFGSLIPGEKLNQPPAKVDHFRVLDEKSSNDPFELYDVLARIDSILSDYDYEFINLSLGPALCIEDDDVHPWTALLDSHLSKGTTLATIAVGNNGIESDPADRRIQVPSDALNALSLGSADSVRSDWGRADYSAVGPGRAPGRVKPDILDFGGTYTEPFIVHDPRTPGRIGQTMGTSFAAPATLRRAVSLRAHFGSRLTPLGIRALLVHSAQTQPTLSRTEVGWGRLPMVLDDIMLCNDGEVRVIYQGELEPAKYLRARIPLPNGRLPGLVTIGATFTFATEVDPEDPGNYSRAGLDVTFRPDDEKFARADSVDPKSRSFFKRTDYDSEKELRNDGQKWETTLSNWTRMQGKGLHNPVFDIHYNARENGGSPRTPRPIPYALVVDVKSPQTADLYDKVLRTYPGIIEAIQPVVDLPVRV
ncbi:S8 family peptidase [Brevibacterium sp. CSND-B09]|uniref:S8 family peptidase n=1 Tax=Brevibacterium sp. CSND-B09 TaxID=3462571 RepID=UPI00406A3E02